MKILLTQMRGEGGQVAGRTTIRARCRVASTPKRMCKPPSIPICEMGLGGGFFVLRDVLQVKVRLVRGCGGSVLRKFRPKKKNAEHPKMPGMVESPNNLRRLFRLRRWFGSIGTRTRSASPFRKNHVWIRHTTPFDSPCELCLIPHLRVFLVTAWVGTEVFR